MQRLDRLATDLLAAALRSARPALARQARQHLGWRLLAPATLLRLLRGLR